ncbi:hypothetical protein M413DRAFT_128880 [Hebeloma cylindrosporum]|uniref:Uncharacterized protein n=1 Tax=Hebeloma cylindrosporum TaxID=76867 RepID=A0A0C3C000_HEBCY|nr:hypothetical protein M413DRAFT_128880 [Hebeloma cylindrosporum h7]
MRPDLDHRFLESLKLHRRELYQKDKPNISDLEKPSTTLLVRVSLVPQLGNRHSYPYKFGSSVYSFPSTIALRLSVDILRPADCSQVPGKLDLTNIKSTSSHHFTDRFVMETF